MCKTMEYIINIKPYVQLFVVGRVRVGWKRWEGEFVGGGGIIWAPQRRGRVSSMGDYVGFYSVLGIIYL